MPNTRILIVEDEAVVARDLSQQLARIGYEPVANTPFGEDALELVGRLRPDLVLMDIQLAGKLDGIATASTIVDQVDLPVVFLTAFSDDAILQRSKLANPFGYIVKPFDERELHSVIEIALSKHQAEARLRRSREELATILRTAMDGFWLCDCQGKLIEVNDAACAMLGYTREELVGMPISTIEAKEDTSEISAHIDTMMRRGHDRFESQHRRKDGRIIDVEVSVTYMPADEGRICAFVRDITEKKRADQALIESEKMFFTTFRSAPLLLAISEIADGTFLRVNDAFERITGYSRDEVIGRTAVELGLLSASDREQLRSCGVGEQVDPLRLSVTTRDGQKLDCLFGAGTAEIGGQLRLITSAIDITSQTRLEAQLRRIQKMDAVGQLAGGVAHDFNNILAGITLLCGLLREAPNLDAENRSCVRDLEKEAARGSSITRQLLAFSRQQVVGVKPLDLTVVVGNLSRMLQRMLGERINVEFKVPPILPAVDGDESMIEQVVMNLSVNARDAMPDGGSLRLSLDTVNLDENAVKNNLDARPGRFVRLSISDTGHGMNSEILARIFEPFFTTKEIGRGTGLGLSIVHGIVKQHKGWIEVESTAGVGTTFRILLPASTKTLGQPSGTAKEPELERGHGELVLLVEDEETVRNIIGSALERKGYRTLRAKNGEDAIVHWQSHKEEINLLLTDIILPGRYNGADLIALFRKDRRNLPILASSGYITTQASQLPTDIFTLPKPYDIRTLLEAVRRILPQQGAKTPPLQAEM